MRSHVGLVFATALAAANALAQGNATVVVEFYHLGLDHYFISAAPAEIAALDAGTHPGWARTGRSFRAYDAAATGTSPVCRFYIPPGFGDSHFYSASPSECGEVRAKFPALVYESPGVMYVGLPDTLTGACATGWEPVYRLWNARADSNHRYTIDPAVRATMIAKGYVPEGYGPDGVAMCAAPPTIVTPTDTIVIPTDITKITYPSSYVTPARPSPAPPNLCALDVASVSYPASHLGRYPLPAVTGAPLDPRIRRGMSIKDVWQKDNPSYVAGCSGDIRPQFQKTLARVKALGVDYVMLAPWTNIGVKSGAWYIMNPAENNSSTMDDVDLEWATQQAHALGLKVYWQNQVGGLFENNNLTFPAPTTDNVNRFFDAFEPYMLERAELFNRIGVDVMTASCQACWTYLGSPDLADVYATRMAAMLPKLRKVFSGQIQMHDHPAIAATPAISDNIDFIITGLWANVIAAEVPTLTKEGLKQKFRDTLEGIRNVRGPFKKPPIMVVGMPSRADYFTTGYVEETFCTAAYDITGYNDQCFQRAMVADYSLQAMFHEAYLEVLKEQAFIDVYAVQGADYWLVDSLTPSNTFPHIAYSPRNKPSEAILKAWFARP